MSNKISDAIENKIKIVRMYLKFDLYSLLLL